MSMSHKIPNMPGVAAEHAYVVYDGQSGSIVHVHKVMIFEDAQAPPHEQHEARALTLAKQFGHGPDELRVIAVAPGELDPRFPRRVDPKTRKLVRADSGQKKSQ